jgi:hypothetical protein
MLGLQILYQVIILELRTNLFHGNVSNSLYQEIAMRLRLVLENYQWNFQNRNSTPA